MRRVVGLLIGVPGTDFRRRYEALAASYAKIADDAEDKMAIEKKRAAVLREHDLEDVPDPCDPERLSHLTVMIAYVRQQARQIATTASFFDADTVYEVPMATFMAIDAAEPDAMFSVLQQPGGPNQLLAAQRRAFHRPRLVTPRI